VEEQDRAAKWAEFALTMTVNFDELRLLMMPDKRLGMSSHRDCILHLVLLPHPCPTSARAFDIGHQ